MSYWIIYTNTYTLSLKTSSSAMTPDSFVNELKTWGFRSSSLLLPILKSTKMIIPQFHPSNQMKSLKKARSPTLYSSFSRERFTLEIRLANTATSSSEKSQCLETATSSPAPTSVTAYSTTRTKASQPMWSLPELFLKSARNSPEVTRC